MRISELQKKDVINLLDGKKIGTIVDAIILNDGTIETLIIEKKKFFFFVSETDIEVKWNYIKKIGEDVILIEEK